MWTDNFLFYLWHFITLGGFLGGFTLVARRVVHRMMGSRSGEWQIPVGIIVGGIALLVRCT